jgi:hypothetical protein
MHACAHQAYNTLCIITTTFAQVPFAVIKVQSEGEVMAALDVRFFEATFDPVLMIIDEMPAPADAGGLLDEYLERELRDKDLAREAITRQLAGKIQANYTALAEGMKQVRVSVCLCCMIIIMCVMSTAPWRGESLLLVCDTHVLALVLCNQCCGAVKFCCQLRRWQ